VQVADWAGEEVGHNLIDSAGPANACDIFLNKGRNICQLKGLFSRKQFFTETLRQGLKALSRFTDGDDVRSNCAQTDHSSDCDCISSDFSPTLLRLEAKRLGLDPEDSDSEDLLRAVYEAMNVQHFSNNNTNDAPS